MNIADIGQLQNYSAKQSVGVSNLKAALNKDSSAAEILLKVIENSGTKNMESSITPYKGTRIDARV